MRKSSSLPALPLRMLAAWLALCAMPDARAQQATSADGPPPVPGATWFAGDQLSGRQDKDVTLDGHAEVKRDDLRVRADQITYDQDTDVAVANGNVRLRRGGLSATGPKLTMQLDANRGDINDVHYRIGETGGNGTADRVEFLETDRYRGINATYTTCTPESPDWLFKASSLDLDDDRKMTTGRGARLYMFDAPILAAPVFSFPLDNSRRSGALPPLMGLTTNGGFDLAVPYYFNLAPNRDLTLYPRLMTKRGEQLGVDFRYLDPDYSGKLHTEYVPNDRLTGTQRWLYSWQHKQTLADGLSAYADMSKVSDDQYPGDFGNSLAAAAQLQYRQELGLNWTSGDWTTLLRSQRFQTLAPNLPTYERTPELYTRYQKFDAAGFDLTFEADATRFVYPTIDNPSGNRLYLTPQLSYPLQTSWGYLTPKVSLDATSYQIDGVAGAAGTNFTRTLPTFSLDSGITLERELTSFSLFGKPMVQTLEPRMLYVYTPYRDQTMIPLFDTAEKDFGFASIFSENPFIGHDRIADNNKLTAGLTSRWFEADSGIQRMSATIAQRFDFTGQQVTLDNTQTTANKLYSDLLAATSVRTLADTDIDTLVDYSQQLSQVMRSSIGARWHPGLYRSLFVGYSYKRPLSTQDVTAFDQILMSAQWPLAPRVVAVARYNYDLQNKSVVDTLAGIEYDAGCWTGRIVAQRFANTFQAMTTHIYFQLELHGLSKVASSTMSVLRLNIPGYQPLTPQPVSVNPNDDE